MKYPQHTTSTQVEVALREIGSWPLRLRELHARLAPHFARPETHQHALRYLQAVLSDIPRRCCGSGPGSGAPISIGPATIIVAVAPKLANPACRAT
jgi:hypothetical protein